MFEHLDNLNVNDVIATVTGVNSKGNKFASTDLRASSKKDAIDKAKIWLFDNGFSSDVCFRVHMEVVTLECIYINE